MKLGDELESTLRYAGAGHPPGLLWKSDSSELVELAENGLFLGPFQSATYNNVSHPVDPGDIFLLYTDGLVEGTSSDGQPFGAERLRHFVRANTGQDPAMFVDNLLNAALVGVREDDVTLLLGKFVASSFR